MKWQRGTDNCGQFKTASCHFAYSTILVFVAAAILLWLLGAQQRTLGRMRSNPFAGKLRVAAGLSGAVLVNGCLDTKQEIHT